MGTGLSLDWEQIAIQCCQENMIPCLTRLKYLILVILCYRLFGRIWCTLHFVLGTLQFASVGMLFLKNMFVNSGMWITDEKF